MNRILMHGRSAFLRGILLLLPMAMTFVVLRWVFRAIMTFGEGPAGGVLALFGAGMTDAPLHPVVVPLLGLAMTIVVVLLVGLIGGNYLGGMIWRAMERLVMRLPLIRWFYGSARQMIDAFSMTGSGAFREVVFVEYPRRGIWCLGFVTATVASPPPAGDSAEHVYVFLPTTPIPTSGYTVILPRSEARPAGMSVDDGLKLIVSGGFIAPRPLIDPVRQRAGS